MNMGHRRIKLEALDSLIHYSFALYLGLPIIICTGYFFLAKFGFFGVDSRINGIIIAIPALILGPPCLIVYLAQRDKLKFRFIQATVNEDSFKRLVKEISGELRWTIRSYNEKTFTIKTHPGFVNQSWGQHITMRQVNGGILLNSIFDPNKGSWFITFGSNTRNINEIRKMLLAKIETLPIAQ
jgi:hypothetical protein